MRSIPTVLPGPVLIQSVVYGDERGFLQEVYRRNVFVELGLSEDFVQENHSRSLQGVVRGMHYQPGMAKLIRCVRGEVFDVVVDIRRGSPTFGQWEGFELNDENHHQLYCPDGFAHGFCVVSDVADVLYRCSTYYDAAAECGFAYDDPDVAIRWPYEFELIPSPRDRAAPSLAALAPELHSRSPSSSPGEAGGS